MKLIEKIGAIIALVVLAAAALGTGYAAPVQKNEAVATPDQALSSLCTFSWVQSNDDGAVSNHDGYNPIDPGGNTGNDPQAAQMPGAACTRAVYNAAATTATGTADTITFHLSNAYPGYHPTIFFGLSNQWATPGVVSSMTFTNPNPALLTMTLKGVSNGQVINAGSEVVGALDIAVGNIPQTGSPNYNLSITIMVTQSGAALSINAVSLPNGQLGIMYNQALTVSNGNPPYTWSVVSGALPGGLSLDAATGTISGTPNAAGIFNFTVSVTDSSESSAGISLSITITSPAPPATTTTTTAPVIVTVIVTEPAAPPTTTTPVVTLSKQVTTTTPSREQHSLIIDMFNATGQLLVNPDGSLAESYTISLPDKSVSLTFSAGTIITADGEIPDRIEVEAVPASEQPGIPDSWQQVSQLYKLVAYNGDTIAQHTVFSQPFLLTIHCDVATIPAGTDAFTAYYQTATGWVGIDSTYNSQTGDVSADVNHFTLFAGMIKHGTTQFAVSRWWSTKRWWIIITTVVALAGFWLVWALVLFRIRKKK